MVGGEGWGEDHRKAGQTVIHKPNATPESPLCKLCRHHYTQAGLPPEDPKTKNLCPVCAVIVRQASEGCPRCIEIKKAIDGIDRRGKRATKKVSSASCPDCGAVLMMGICPDKGSEGHP